MNTIKLGKKIKDNNSLYFIADIGANHNGSLE
jgi:N-acetylneuraminate synthase